jgi:hypothetical protein
MSITVTTRFLQQEATGQGREWTTSSQKVAQGDVRYGMAAGGDAEFHCIQHYIYIHTGGARITAALITPLGDVYTWLEETNVGLLV